MVTTINNDCLSTSTSRSRNRAISSACLFECTLVMRRTTLFSYCNRRIRSIHGTTNLRGHIFICQNAPPSAKAHGRDWRLQREARREVKNAARRLEVYRLRAEEEISRQRNAHTASSHLSTSNATSSTQSNDCTVQSMSRTTQRPALTHTTQSNMTKHMQRVRS